MNPLSPPFRQVAQLPFMGLNGALKAAGEATRLRILALLAEAELTVSDLTDILRQSQPRISRHLKLLAEAGLVERFREGSWAFFRLGEHGGSAELARDLSLDMLAMARARLDRAGLRHCSVRQGDIYDLALPRDSFDLVIVHQVLHFLDDSARAIQEAARVLRPSGRLLVVDFAPHDLEFLRDEHAHRRLGFAPETVTQWLTAAGLEVLQQKTLPPEPNSDGKIAVSLWLARDPRIAMAGAAREVA